MLINALISWVHCRQFAVCWHNIT